jgi:hypothetical protein
MTRAQEVALTAIALAVLIGTIVFGILRLYTES